MCKNFFKNGDKYVEEMFFVHNGLLTSCVILKCNILIKKVYSLFSNGYDHQKYKSNKTCNSSTSNL